MMRRLGQTQELRNMPENLAGKVWDHVGIPGTVIPELLHSTTLLVSLWKGRGRHDQVHKTLLTTSMVTEVGVLAVKTKPRFFTPFTKAASSVNKKSVLTEIEQIH